MADFTREMRRRFGQSAETSGSRMPIQVAHTLAGHRNPIYATPFFKLDIYALHETLYDEVQ